MQFQCQSVAHAADGDLPRRARAQHDACVTGGDALGQHLAGVVDDVEHGLDELLAVAADLGDGDVVVAHHRQPARELRQHERTHVLAHLVDVHRAHAARVPVRLEQPVHQRLQAVGLVDDDARVLGELARVDLHGQQLRRAADAAQRVLDLVREVAHELLVGGSLPAHALLAALALLLLELHHLHHHLPRHVGLAHHDMHGQRLGLRQRGAPEVAVEAADGHLVGGHRAQRLAQRGGVHEPVEQARAQQLPARLPHHGLEHGVDGQAAAVGLRQRHHGAQQVEGGEARRGGLLAHGPSLPISRRSAATSASLRWMAARISPTRSR
jgi:hypothetical protein